MSPERLNRKPYDEGSDVWALGVIMFCLIAANFPFPGATMTEMWQNVNNPRLPNYKELGKCSKGEFKWEKKQKTIEAMQFILFCPIRL